MMRQNSRRIYLSPPHMSEEGYEIKFVMEGFESGWIAPLGPMVDAFEEEFASWVGIPYAVALSSGTAALHLSLIASGVEPGDEVICSSFTFAATANAITYVGARPIFIDSEAQTWNMDPNLLEDFLKKRSQRGSVPKMAIVVDALGQSADYHALIAICHKYGVDIVEDAAEALGARYRGEKCGTFGKIGVFSFNGNKIITTSGGGMLVSEERTIAEKTRFLATQAREPVAHYEHNHIGFNYRLSNILAAIGRGQLRVLDRRIEQKRAIFNAYYQRLKDLPGIEFMPEPEGFFSTRWLTSILIDPNQFGATREEVRQALENLNIEARPLWKPMHLQPVFSQCEAVGGRVSERLFEQGLSLPSGTALTIDQIEIICHTVHSLYKG